MFKSFSHILVLLSMWFYYYGEASSVVNIDMSKASLSTGRINHHLNNLDTKM